MSIKAVKSLIKNVKTTSSDIVNFNFRSPGEVKLYLDSVRKFIRKTEASLEKDERIFTSVLARLQEVAVRVVTIDRYGKVPKTQNIKNVDWKNPEIEPVKISDAEKRAIKKNYGVITQLHDKIETLESIEIQLNSLLKDLKGRQQAAKYIKSMKIAAEKAIKKALGFLSMAKKKDPSNRFTEMTDAIIANLLQRIEGTRIKKSVTSLYRTITEEGDAVTYWFTKYLGLQGFVDDGGFPYNEYWVVFTAKIDPTLIPQYFVNTFTKFRAPGTFNPEHHPFSDPKSGGLALDSLLAGENFTSVVRRMPMPLIKDKLKPEDFNLKGLIKSVDMTEDHSLLVTFTKQVNEKSPDLQGMVEEIFAKLRTTLAPKSRGRLSYRKTHSGANFAIEFMYFFQSSDSVDAMELNIQQLKLLQNRLGLSEKQVQDIVHLLHK